jgi:hypothetical protein
MYLIHKSSVKNPDGVVDIEVLIVNKEIKKYTYHLSSEWAARKFHHLYRKGKATHGKALAVLNKFKIKEEGGTLCQN